MFDPRGERLIRTRKGSAAESVNSQLSRLLRTIRYLGLAILIPILSFRTFFMNLAQKAKQASGFSDVESLDLTESGYQITPCMCNGCLEGRESDDSDVRNWFSAAE